MCSRTMVRATPTGIRSRVATETPIITAKASKEPLATLATYRARDGQVFFGQNCVHRSLSSIRVGDPVEVLDAE